MPRLRSLVPVLAAAALLAPAAPAAAQDGDEGGSRPYTVVEHYLDRVCAMAAEDFRFLDRQLDYLPDRVAGTGRHVVYAAEGTVYVTCRALKPIVIE